VLTGTVTSVSLAPSAFNDQQLATRYAVTVVMKFEFRDVRENKILWENPALLFRDEFDLPSGSSTAPDANVFFGQEGSAVIRLSENFAKSVVTSILEAF
jgi:hypothetical protein